MRFTDRTLAAIPSPAREQGLYADDTISCFGLRVDATAKVFMLAMGEDRRRITTGRYSIDFLSQAREKAKSILANRQLGFGHQPAAFLGEAREQFPLSRWAKDSPSTAQRDERVLKRSCHLTESVSAT